MTAKYRTYSALLALHRFTVDELAAASNNPPATVRTHLARLPQGHLKAVGVVETGRRGGRPTVYELLEEGVTHLRATIQALIDSIGAGQPQNLADDDDDATRGQTMSDPEDLSTVDVVRDLSRADRWGVRDDEQDGLPPSLLAAEDLLLLTAVTRTPNVEERVEYLDQARISLASAHAKISRADTSVAGVNTRFVTANFLWELADAELKGETGSTDQVVLRSLAEGFQAVDRAASEESNNRDVLKRIADSPIFPALVALRESYSVMAKMEAASDNRSDASSDLLDVLGLTWSSPQANRMSDKLEQVLVQVGAHFRISRKQRLEQIIEAATGMAPAVHGSRGALQPVLFLLISESGVSAEQAGEIVGPLSRGVQLYVIAVKDTPTLRNVVYEHGGHFIPFAGLETDALKGIVTKAMQTPWALAAAAYLRTEVDLASESGTHIDVRRTRVSDGRAQVRAHMSSRDR